MPFTPPSREWLLRMAEAEGNGITSVGGLVCRIKALDELLACYAELLSYYEADQGWDGEPDDQVPEFVLRARQAYRRATS